jgi:isocitrate/isopropylmalate dehydrogenase
MSVKRIPERVFTHHSQTSCYQRNNQKRICTSSSAYITKLCKLQMIERLLSFTVTTAHRRTNAVMSVATSNRMHKLLGYIPNHQAVCCPITYRSEFALKKFIVTELVI